MEQWEDITGYEGIYQISTYGRFKSLKRKYVPEDRILKPYNLKAKYWEIGLSKGTPRIAKNYRIHRLMGVMFLGVDENSTVNHIDGDSHNNTLNNLEKMSLSSNIKHAWHVLGSHKKHHESVRAKLTKEQIIEIRSRGDMSNTKLAPLYGVSRQTIDNVKNFKTYNYDF
jgi:DNA-binding transcriptional regulator YiaG